MNNASTGLIGLLSRFIGKLRYPQLFLITGAIFLLDLLIPDLVPFADEILLALTTSLLGGIKKRTVGEEPASRPDQEEE